MGGNLVEHPHVPVEFAARRPVTFLNELRFDRVAFSVLQWALTGGGALAKLKINSWQYVVIRTCPDLSQPDVQLMCNPVRMDANIWFPGISRRQQHRITAGVVILQRGRAVGACRRLRRMPPMLPRIRLESV